jgi:membrane fusion protein (multidrug efflux system)
MFDQIRRLFGALLIAAALLLSTAVSGADREPTPVIAVEVQIKKIYDRVEALGTLRANETVEITASVTDTITAINFSDGQTVAKGDILVEMTSSEEHAQLEEEISRRQEAQKRYERVVSLVARGAASQAQLDERKREIETAGARLRAIESRLQDRLIKAPFSGVVGLRNISLGALVEPGDVITTLDDVSSMKLDFNVPSIYLVDLKKGTAVQAFSPAFPGRQFNGSVSSIDSRVDPVTRAIVVRAKIDNTDRLLKPGLLMTVQLLKNERNVLMIPEEALIPTGDKNVVLLVDDSSSSPVARQQEVVIGTRRVGEVEIIEGLRPKDKVVTHGTLKVRPGQEISIRGMDEPNKSLRELLSGESSGGSQ